jgi:hypothetical protein
MDISCSSTWIFVSERPAGGAYLKRWGFTSFVQWIMGKEIHRRFDRHCELQINIPQKVCRALNLQKACVSGMANLWLPPQQCWGGKSNRRLDLAQPKSRFCPRILVTHPWLSRETWVYCGQRSSYTFVTLTYRLAGDLQTLPRKHQTTCFYACWSPNLRQKFAEHIHKAQVGD